MPVRFIPVRFSLQRQCEHKANRATTTVLSAPQTAMPARFSYQANPVFEEYLHGGLLFEEKQNVVTIVDLER